MSRLQKYRSIVFDCDGVILNSNGVKATAFYKAALLYGEDAAQKMYEYHIDNCGVSRYPKFEYFLNSIVACGSSQELVKELVDRYAFFVSQELFQCEVSGALDELKKLTPGSTWFVVSGGDHEELNSLFLHRGIRPLFEGGVYGSPRDKDAILSELVEKKLLEQPRLFIGDSRYDHEVACRFAFDFVFLSEWTNFRSWSDYCKSNSVRVEKNLASLLEYSTKDA